MPLAALRFASDCAREYGKIRTFLEKNGSPIGSLDALIAGLTVVTNNTREFQRVPGLSVVDWTQA